MLVLVLVQVTTFEKKRKIYKLTYNPELKRKFLMWPSGESQDGGGDEI